ncbi:MAG: class I SAM-dependent methyltransferase [Anaerolineae bacterium]|nr:class I SAM-dependent methyltransferase [Anaerolineae bacterium]MDW8173996.1 class I SAM-dependent methyltransferase [Anaerolineae bacterium]
MSKDALYRSNQKHFDEEIGDIYAEARNSYANRLYYDFWSAWMLSLVPIKPSMIALDCMGGSSEVARVLRPQVAQLHCVDISQKLLGYPVQDEVRPDVRVCADVHHLPYADATFDLVFIRGGLHHVAQTFELALSEIGRVMKPGAWLICAEPNDHNPLTRLARQIVHRVSDKYEPQERGFSRDELSRGLRTSGFVDEAFFNFGHLGYTLIGNTDVLPVFRNLRNRWLINSLILFDRLSTRVPLWKRLSLALVFRARK